MSDSSSNDSNFSSDSEEDHNFLLDEVYYNKSVDKLKNKEIKRERKIKSIYDVDSLLPNDILELVLLTDEILETNQENINEIFEKIEKYGKNIQYIAKFIEFALIIRPKNIANSLKLFEKIFKKFNFKHTLNIFSQKTIKNMLYLLNIIGEEKYSQKKTFYSLKVFVHKDDYVFKTMQELIDIFEEGTVWKAIKDDDVASFIKLYSEPSFNPKETIKFQSKQFNCLNLMAYFGSIKCFKYALLDGGFDSEEIQKNAIIGGNKEIIHLLEQNNYSFDGCLIYAAAFHRNNLIDWLLDNYKNNAIEPKMCIRSFNDRAYFFLLFNGYGKTRMFLCESFIDSIETNHICMAKYLFNELNVSAKGRSLVGIMNSPLIAAVLNNDMEIVKFLVECCKVGDSYENLVGDNALNAAVKEEYYDIAKYLIEKGVSRPTSDIFIAIKNGSLDFVKYLIEKDNSLIYMIDEKRMSTPLYAYETNHIDIFYYIIEKDPNIMEKIDKDVVPIFSKMLERKDLKNAKFFAKKYQNILKQHSLEDAKGPLQVAIINENLEMLKFLVEECHLQYNSESCKLKLKYNPLYIACSENNLEIVKYLIEELGLYCDSYPLEKEVYDMPIFWAIKNENFEMVKILMEKGHASVNELGYYGMTPFEAAIFGKNIPIAEYILENHDPNLNHIRKNTLEILFNSYNPKVIKKFYKLGLLTPENVNTKSHDEFVWKAVSNNDVDLCKILFSKLGFDYNEINSNGWNYLHAAAKNGSIELIKYMTSLYDIDPFVLTDYFETPFFIACENNQTELVKFMIDSGCANVDDFLFEKNKNHDLVEKLKPLCSVMSAVERNNLEEVKKLVEVDHLSPLVLVNGRKPIHQAILNDNLEMLKYLVEECHANVNDKTNYVDTYNIEIIKYCPTHLAILRNNIAILKYLIEECKADIETNCSIYIDEKYTIITPLCFAVKNARGEIIRYLIEECHANVTQIDPKYIYFIVAQGDLETLNCIIKKGDYYLGQFKKFKKSLLNYAITIGKTDIVKYFVEECRMKITQKDYKAAKDDVLQYLSGLYTLNNALCNGDLETVKKQVEKFHVTVNFTLFNQSPLTIAIEKENFLAVKYLINHNSDIASSDISDVYSHNIIAYLRRKIELITAVRNEDFDAVIKITKNTKYDLKRTYDGKTALEYAKDLKNKNIYNYLSRL